MDLTKIGKEGITGISNASDANAITIDSSENVGIGTTSPDEVLHIHSDSIARLKITGSSGQGEDNGIKIFQNGVNTSIANGDNGYMRFYTNNTERLRITSSGELLIGSTTGGSSSSLHVQGNGTLSVFQVADANSGTARNAILFRNSSSAGVGSIQVNSTSVAYNTSSDHRLKENVDYTFDATTRLKQLKPARFNFIADADTTVDGFLAHEVQSVVPEAITGTHNEVDDDGNAVYQGIDQSKIVPLLVKTIQELEARITALENA